MHACVDRQMDSVMATEGVKSSTEGVGASSRLVYEAHEAMTTVETF